MNEKLALYLEKIFSSDDEFERIIFEIETNEDRRAVMVDLASYVVNQSDLKTKLNFKLIKSYNALDVSDMAFAIVRVLFDEVVDWAQEHFPKEKGIAAAIQEDRLKMYMLHTLGMRYFDEFQGLFFDAIAESFFDLIHEAESFRHVSKIAQDAITGNAKNRSLFLLDNGSQIVRRADQVWIRVDQAHKIKKRQLYTLANDLKKYKADLEDMQVRLKAFEIAQTLTPEMLTHYSAERVREIFTEEKAEFALDRRVLGYIPSGDLAYQMETLCERAAINAKTPVAREEFKQIQTFFTKAKMNNTPTDLKMRRDEIVQKLPHRKQRYKEMLQQYQTLKEDPIFIFDEQLAKIKEVMVANLAHRKIER
ncbi:MAG: hypothetical protein KU37_08150 [Sulfuricurvum sp. PC08-66]|nr:MAG: hypothetical protein KU37_08150 [Sulfuricurvum sp. PC08-66]